MIVLLFINICNITKKHNQIINDILTVTFTSFII